MAQDKNEPISTIGKKRRTDDDDMQTNASIAPRRKLFLSTEKPGLFANSISKMTDEEEIKRQLESIRQSTDSTSFKLFNLMLLLNVVGKKDTKTMSTTYLNLYEGAIQWRKKLKEQAAQERLTEKATAALGEEFEQNLTLNPFS